MNNLTKIPADLTIGIIGNGVVGNATARTWMEHAEVRVYDTNPLRRTHTWEQVLSCHVVFLCLPTPPYSSQRIPPGAAPVNQSEYEGEFIYNECDITEIEKVCTALKDDQPNGTYALRSTVPIGTTKNLKISYKLPNLVHNPEFLTARCAVTDAQTPARNIIGGEIITGTDLRRLYQLRFPGIPVHCLTSEESELVKLTQNSFFAVKVAFFNEIRALSDKLHLRWEIVLEAILSDGRIAHSHTKVPGPDGKYGFGGSCLPKDLGNMIHCLGKNGCSAIVTSAAQARNSVDRGRTS